MSGTPWLTSSTETLETLTGRPAPMGSAGWATWRQSEPYTVGIEEEVMLLDPATWELAQRGDEVLARASPELAGRCAAETHEAALELRTGPHATVRDAIAELRELRSLLVRDLAALGMAAASFGAYPGPVGEPTRVSPSSRYQVILTW
jgi:carboxylate-amine ligase